MKEKGRKEEEMKSFNAPPVPPFTNYQPIGNFSRPSMTMIQPAAPTTTQSFQPLGPVPSMIQPQAQTTTPSFQPLGPVPTQGYPAANAQMWAAPPYPVGPAYNQFYQ